MHKINTQKSFNLVSKIKSFGIALLFCLLVSSCGDNDDVTQPEENLHLRNGYINIYYKGGKIELKEITSYNYLNSAGDILGNYYTGYVDKKHLVSNNSVSLYISNNSELYRIEYVYSLAGTNYGTQYANYADYYDNSQTLLKHTLVDDGKVIKGRFEGKLFNAVDIIDVDSCIFYIEK